MPAVVDTLLREPEALIAEVRSRPRIGGLNLRLLAAGAAGAALYGASVGCYVGGVNLLLTTVKMPVFFLLTLLLTFALMHVVLVIARAPVRPSQTLAVALSGISLTTIVLGALAPVLGFFAATAPLPHYPTYLTLVLVNVAACVIAGSFGVRAMSRGLRALLPADASVGTILAAWVLIYQFVGAQVAWLLRPWVGDARDVGALYSLEHGLRGNFYVAVWNATQALLQQTGGGS